MNEVFRVVILQGGRLLVSSAMPWIRREAIYNGGVRRWACNVSRHASHAQITANHISHHGQPSADPIQLMDNNTAEDNSRVQQTPTADDNIHDQQTPTADDKTAVFNTQLINNFTFDERTQLFRHKPTR